MPLYLVASILFVSSTFAQINTGGVVPNPTGTSPLPTARPRSLLARQQLELTSICGYDVNGLSEPFDCQEGRVCAYNESDGVFGCCDAAEDGDTPSNCEFQTTCIDSRQSLTSLDESAASKTVECFDSTAAYCAMDTLAGLSAYYCTNAPGLTFTLVSASDRVQSTFTPTTEATITASNTTITSRSTTTTASGVTRSNTTSPTRASPPMTTSPNAAISFQSGLLEPGLLMVAIGLLSHLL